MAPHFEDALLSRRFSFPPAGLFHAPLRADQQPHRDSVNAKLDSGEYALEAVPCFCGGTDFKTLASVDRYTLRSQTVLCRRCGLLSTNPRMSEAAYARFYDGEYRRMYGDEIRTPETRFAEGLELGRVVHAFVAGRLPSSKPGLAFEIGSNLGATLSVFQSHGYEVAGTDYGSRSIELGKTLSGVQRLYVGDISRLEEDGRKADLFILQHVLEHFLDLEGMLRRIRGLLQPDGHIFIEVPGIYSWISTYCKNDFLEYLQNAHTYYFSLATLDYVMECCGFERVAGDEYIRSLYKVSKNFRAKKAAPESEAAKVEDYLRGLERRITPRLILKKTLASLGILRLRDHIRDSLK